MKPIGSDSFIRSWSNNNGVEIKEDKVLLTDDDFKKLIEAYSLKYANCFSKTSDKSVLESDAHILVKRKSEWRSG